MTFGRWLLVHSLSICILIMLGLGYVYKEELKLQEAYSQLLSIDSEALTQEKENSSSGTTVSGKEVNSSSNQNMQVRETNGATNPVVAQGNQQVVNVLSKSSSTVTLKRPLPKTKVEPIASTLKPQERLQESVTNNTDIDYLLQAREAYWDKNYQLAVNLYTDEINKTPDSPDLYGELGNIYYRLNNYEIASSHYLKAGELFIKTNDQLRAKQIYDILISIAPAKAQILLNFKNQQQQ